MTADSMAMTASAYEWARTAADTTYSLARKPVVKGIPVWPREQHCEREGQRRLTTAEAAIDVEVVIMIAPAADDSDHREAPDHQQRVHEDVIDTSGNSLAGRSRKADEDEPGVIDRRVREHPLHIALHKTEDRTEQQREDRQRPQQRLPIRAKHPERGEEDASSAAKPPAFARAVMNPVAGVGAPW